MKYLIRSLAIASVFFGVVPDCARACTPLQISITRDIRLVEDRDVCGLSVNLPGPAADAVTGIDVGVVGANERMTGIEVNLIANVTFFSVGEQDGVRGIQIGGLFNWLYNSELSGLQAAGVANIAQKATGIQIAGIANSLDGDSTALQISLTNDARNIAGVQVGLIYNSASAPSGAQLGVVNRAHSVSGIQIGVLNIADELHGVQLGLLNVAKRGKVPFLPVINVHF